MENTAQISESNNKDSLHNWLNQNRELLRPYLSKWIAFTEKGIVCAGDSIETVKLEADKLSKSYVLFFVRPDIYQVRFRPIHFRSVFFHQWTPSYSVNLQFGKVKLEVSMIIDSGADGSLLSYDTGLALGLNMAEGELIQEAKGIGGGVIRYIWRNIDITIEGHTIKAPFAWIIEGENQENIIGRQVIFDAFDIEFRQADEKIIFRYREDFVKVWQI